MGESHSNMILNTVKIKIKPVVTTISELKLQCQRSMNLWYIFSGLKNCTYHYGDLKTKRKIIGSIFPEKLVFNGNNYRTARVNEAVELIYNVGQGFSENKNGQSEVNFDLSTQVNRIGLPYASLRSSKYSCEVLTQKITQAVHPLREYTLFSLFT
jgi:hypothetical protein